MKKLIGRSLLGVVALGVGFVGITNAQTAAGFGGTWYSGASTTMSVSEKDGFIDVWGKDSSTIYNCSGIVEKTAEGSVVHCYGSGMNHVLNSRFQYSSRMKLIEKGAAIDEMWDARQYVDGKLDKFSGDATFRRKRAETK